MSELDPLILARIQFAFTVSFHIIFPTISLASPGDDAGHSRVHRIRLPGLSRQDAG